MSTLTTTTSSIEAEKKEKEQQQQQNHHHPMPHHLSFDFDIDRYLNPFVPRNRVHLLPKPIAWFLGHRDSPSRPIGTVLIWWWSFFGALCGILVVEAVFHTKLLTSDGAPIVIGSLGASAILEYNTIDSPLSQPRNVLLGQLFSSIIGVSITKLFELSPNFESIRWVGGALAVGLASAFMGFSKTVHPPAGATALLAVTSNEITHLGWYLVPLILLGSSLMLGVACLLNNIQRKFPMYWWTPMDVSREERLRKGQDDLEKAETRRSEDEVTIRDQSPGPDRPLIIIDPHNISIPDWVALDNEERSMLEVFRGKLLEGLSSSQSRDSQATHVAERTATTTTTHAQSA